MILQTPTLHGLMLTALVLTFGVGCELNNSTPDVEATIEEVTESDSDDAAEAEDTDETPDTGTTTTDGPPLIQSDCSWVSGTWDLVDCFGSDVVVEFITDGCSFQTTSNSPILVGAFGSAFQSGMTFTTQSLKVCHGFYDGDYLTGACNASTDVPCWFLAQRR